VIPKSDVSDPQLVFDTTPLIHFARADRLDVLGDLMSRRRCVTTSVVRDEIIHGGELHPQLHDVLDLEWIELLSLDDPGRLLRFSQWMRRVGVKDGGRNLGEASVFAIAEEIQAVAVVDDRDAVRVARNYGLEVHGTVWLLARECSEGKLTETNACNIIDALKETEMRLPCTGLEFPEYSAAHGLEKWR
jgi:predicted nucleic acid-binding protein